MLSCLVVTSNKALFSGVSKHEVQQELEIFQILGSGPSSVYGILTRIFSVGGDQMTFSLVKPRFR